jgi:AraC-like DNA-binding protein
MAERRARPGVFYRYFPLSARDRKWGLFVTTTGETWMAPNQPYPPPGHPKQYDFKWSQGRVLHDHQAIYISHGRGWLETEHTARQTVEMGTVFLLFPGVWHRYMPDPRTGWREHWVGFDGETARRWMTEKFFSPRKPILQARDEDLLLTLYGRIRETAKANEPAVQQVLAGTVSQIVGLLYSAQQALLSSGQVHSQSAVQRAIERMQTARASEGDLPALARELHVSYSWFRRMFARHTGLSPHQYLLELKLVRARNLLSGTELTVKEVARQTGFADEHYFCRLFGKKTGLTPSQWRSRSSVAQAR